jgi:hypothetical protein
MNANSTEGGGEEAAGASRDFSLAACAWSGLSLGVVHVVTGPDHLSAIATLSVGSSWRAFGIGVRWGCGHSAGLVLMTAVLRSFRLNIENVTRICETLVGVAMLTLGAVGVLRAVRNRRRNAASSRMSEEEMRELQTLKSDGATVAPRTRSAAGSRYLPLEAHPAGRCVHSCP